MRNWSTFWWTTNSIMKCVTCWFLVSNVIMFYSISPFLLKKNLFSTTQLQTRVYRVKLKKKSMFKKCKKDFLKRGEGGIATTKYRIKVHMYAVSYFWSTLLFKSVSIKHLYLFISKCQKIYTSHIRISFCANKLRTTVCEVWLP